jgi:hypothetical protein
MGTARRAGDRGVGLSKDGSPAAKHRTRSAEFNRQVARDFLGGDPSMRVWIASSFGGVSRLIGGTWSGRLDGAAQQSARRCKCRDVVKTLNVEADYPMAYESFEDADAHIPHFIDDLHNRRRLHSVLGCLSAVQFEEQTFRGALQSGVIFNADCADPASSAGISTSSRSIPNPT